MYKLLDYIHSVRGQKISRKFKISITFLLFSMPEHLISPIILRISGAFGGSPPPEPAEIVFTRYFVSPMREKDPTRKNLIRLSGAYRTEGPKIAAFPYRFHLLIDREKILVGKKPHSILA